MNAIAGKFYRHGANGREIYWVSPNQTVWCIKSPKLIQGIPQQVFWLPTEAKYFSPPKKVIHLAMELLNWETQESVLA